MATATPPRRFKVEPIETIVISSKHKQERTLVESTERVQTCTLNQQETIHHPSNDGLSHHRSMTAKVSQVRRFSPQPIETSAKSSKDRPQEERSKNTAPPRKFAPEPIETVTRASRKFSPKPIETTWSSNRAPASASVESVTPTRSRKKFAEEWNQQTALSPKKQRPEILDSALKHQENTQTPRRHSPKKFVPQLIETAQRSRKAGVSSPTPPPSDQAKATPNQVISPRHARILGIQPTPTPITPAADLSQNPLFLEIQTHACPLARRPSYFGISQHSFRVPDLEPIESSESEASSPPSPTILPSITVDYSFMYEEITRRRESVDDRSSGYLLSLAAKAAERQLRDQALAAFPNTEHHEPVDHFVDCDVEESGSSTAENKAQPKTSSSKDNWDLWAIRDYQQHNARTGRQRPGMWSNRQRERTKSGSAQVESAAGFLNATPAKKLARQQRDPELERMREGARPPMLGENLEFPRCSSPEPCRFDTTQGCDAAKTAMCYLSEQSKFASETGESLWCGKGNGRQTSKTPSLWSTANSRASSTHGLWGGLCANGGDNSPRGPTGILTPHHEKAIPLSPCPTPSRSLLPPTPPASAYGITTDFSGLDERLALEQSITEDFSDDFITQVYNYLSLGYPSMARPFDEELSKISKIPVSDLRQDDYLAESRGYIRLGRDGNLVDSHITEESCMRWRALRTYVQEWARQHPGMAEEDALGGGRGTAIRKGSWAL